MLVRPDMKRLFCLKAAKNGLIIIMSVGLCWVWLGWGGVRQHGSGWSWVGAPLHDMETHGFGWVASGLVRVGLSWVEAPKFGDRRPQPIGLTHGC